MHSYNLVRFKMTDDRCGNIRENIIYSYRWTHFWNWFLFEKYHEDEHGLRTLINIFYPDKRRQAMKIFDIFLNFRWDVIFIFQIPIICWFQQLGFYLISTHNSGKLYSHAPPHFIGMLTQTKQWRGTSTQIFYLLNKQFKWNVFLNAASFDHLVDSFSGRLC